MDVEELTHNKKVDFMEEASWAQLPIGEIKEKCPGGSSVRMMRDVIEDPSQEDKKGIISMIACQHHR